MGSPADVQHAEWFADLWALHERRGFGLRRLHYAILGMALDANVPYANTKEHWADPQPPTASR